MVAFALNLKINLCPQQVSAIGCTPPCNKKVGTCLAHLGRARARCELGAEPPWIVGVFAISRAGRRDPGRDHGQVR